MNQFFIENASGILAIIGAIIGGIISSIPIIVFQYLQRKWHIEDEIRQLRRSRLLITISPIQEWLDNILRFSQDFLQWSYGNHGSTEATKITGLSDDVLQQRFSENFREQTNIETHVLSIGDKELISQIEAIIDLRTKYIDALSSKDETHIKGSILSLQIVASKTARRIEFLIEQAKPIGDQYTSKPKHKNGKNDS